MTHTIFTRNKTHPGQSQMRNSFSVNHSQFIHVNKVSLSQSQMRNSFTDNHSHNLFVIKVGLSQSQMRKAITFTIYTCNQEHSEPITDEELIYWQLLIKDTLEQWQMRNAITYTIYTSSRTSWANHRWQTYSLTITSKQCQAHLHCQRLPSLHTQTTTWALGSAKV